MRVCTWNVNSLRARLPRVLEMLEKHAPDVALLQETKVAPDQYPEAELQAAGYESVHHSGGQWAGVAIGFVCSLLAVAVFVWGIALWAIRHDFPGPLFLGGLVLGVLGVQGFILALVGEYLGRIQRDVEGRPLYTIEREIS